MIKKLFRVLVMALPLILLSACSDNDSDEPQNPTVDKSKDWSITINLDGTNSKGLPYRFISATEFMLNYVTYAVVDGHINVIGADQYEVENTLGGNLAIFESITFMGTNYKVREIKDNAFRGLAIAKLKLPVSINVIGHNTLPNKLKELYFRSLTPPVIRFITNEQVEGLPFTAETMAKYFPLLKIYVPKGATAAYKEEKRFCQYFEIFEYDL